MTSSKSMPTGAAVLLLGVFLAATLATAVARADHDTPESSVTTSGRSTTVSVIGFAVTRAATHAAQASFERTGPGQGTKWVESYGPSGEQSRSVLAGLDADYVHFSIDSDVTRLVDEGLVAADWNAGANQGIVSRSVVVIAVRPGNPKNIQGWADLVRDGVGIVTPNPGSSGAARWNVLAAYGQVLADGGTDEEAADYLARLFRNVVSLPGSGRDATTAFLSGTGDVLISYENESIQARQHGAKLDYLVPDATLLIENPGAVLIDAAPRATQWLDFVVSDAGQAAFATTGFRPIRDTVTGFTVDGANDPAEPFLTPSKLFTIKERFGSWEEAGEKFFAARTGIVSSIQASAGKA